MNWAVCMYISTYICIYTYICICIYTHILYVYICSIENSLLLGLNNIFHIHVTDCTKQLSFAFPYPYFWKKDCVFISACMCSCVYFCLSMCNVNMMCTCVSLCIYMCVFMWIGICAPMHVHRRMNACEGDTLSVRHLGILKTN